MDIVLKLILYMNFMGVIGMDVLYVFLFSVSNLNI